jgi:hypothetical protein
MSCFVALLLCAASVANPKFGSFAELSQANFGFETSKSMIPTRRTNEKNF